LAEQAAVLAAERSVIENDFFLHVRLHESFEKSLFAVQWFTQTRRICRGGSMRAGVVRKEV
jgi:hypothetical protein